MTEESQETVSAEEADTRITVRLFKRESNASFMMQLLTGKSPKDKKGDPMIEPPPIEPEDLAALFEISGILRPNIEAYVTNIDSQGHHFEPAIDLNAPDADERVQDSMFVMELMDAKAADKDLSQVKVPSKEAADAKIGILRRTARLELARARSFFSTCNPDGTFEDLRQLTRQDLEITGNGWWEVLRDKAGLPRTLHHLPSVEMRIGKNPVDLVVKTLRQITDIEWELVKVRRTFRLFSKVDLETKQPRVWYKQFGDPRTISSASGKVYKDLLALKHEEGEDTKEATEVFHFALHSCSSPYGLPRWIGNLPNVLGSRELDETNLDYFLSNAVPALALLVAGGRFAKGVEEKLKEFFEEEVRGRRATHKLVVLEAETQRRPAQGPTINPRIDFVPLRNAQVQDALFQKYDERNHLKTGTSFRLPVSFSKGDVKLPDLRMAEDQVFEPNRGWFDARINKFFMPALGIRFWAFVTNSLTTSDSEVIGKLALAYGKEGFLLPAEVRKIAEKVFNTNLPPVRAKWATTPMPFTLAIFGMKAGPAEAVREQGRQAGDPAPVDDALSELGLDPEEAAVSPVNPGSKDDDGEGSAGSLDALEALRALGVQI
jgi:capsid portal protein